jgi:hypothetical protein
MMNSAIFWWIPCGILFLVVAKYITGDRETLRRLMEERAGEMAGNDPIKANPIVP